VREGGVEAVSADNLVQVGRGDEAGVYEGVEALGNELGALEAQHGRNGEVVLGGDMVEEKEKSGAGWQGEHGGYARRLFGRAYESGREIWFEVRYILLKFEHATFTDGVWHRYRPCGSNINFIATPGWGLGS
jgi:hypothetical protein